MTEDEPLNGKSRCGQRGCEALAEPGVFYCDAHAPDYEANSAVDRKERRLRLRCSHCPPNRKENASRKPKHVPKAKKTRRT